MAEKIQLAIDFIQSNPDEAARILEEQPVEEAGGFLTHIESVLAAKVLACMLPAPAARCVAVMQTEEAAKILSHLRPITAASVLRCLPIETRDPILRHMHTRISLMCSVILNYSPKMIGAWMNPLALAVPSTCTVFETWKRIHDDPYDDYRDVFVVDVNNILLGTISLDALISAEESAPLSKIMKSAEHSLPDRGSLSSVADHPGWRTLDELPVIDRSQKFLGVLRYADLRQALLETSVDVSAIDTSNTLMGFIEGSFQGLTDIVNATISTSGPAGQPQAKENDHDR